MALAPLTAVEQPYYDAIKLGRPDSDFIAVDLSKAQYDAISGMGIKKELAACTKAWAHYTTETLSKSSWYSRFIQDPKGRFIVNAAAAASAAFGGIEETRNYHPNQLAGGIFGFLGGMARELGTSENQDIVEVRRQRRKDKLLQIEEAARKADTAPDPTVDMYKRYYLQVSRYNHLKMAKPSEMVMVDAGIKQAFDPNVRIKGFGPAATNEGTIKEEVIIRGTLRQRAYLGLTLGLWGAESAVAAGIAVSESHGGPTPPLSPIAYDMASEAGAYKAGKAAMALLLSRRRTLISDSYARRFAKKRHII